VCNDFQRQIEWETYCKAMADAKLGMPAEASAAQLPPAADVRVNDLAPVMRPSGNVVELTPMRWGFPPARAAGAPLFNFRSDGRRFAPSKRCLVPASAFFEFTGSRSPKSKWMFRLADHALFAVAGLWREAEDGPGAFTMLTTKPGADVAPYHDRQIAVLAPRDWAAWLYLDRPEAELLRPLPAGSLIVSLERRGAEEPPSELMRLAARPSGSLTH
jgi:putative SOS response-associated peptidase YedK